MSRPKMFLTLLATAAMLCATAQAWACDHCCQCGANCGTRKVCRLKCETKKIEKVCYGCECEDYCLPGKSERGCLESESVCTGCNKDCCAQSPLCCLEWFKWCPGCASPHHRKKLVKYVVTKEVPSYKWVTEEVCSKCCPDSCCDQREGGVMVERPKTADVPTPLVGGEEGPMPPAPPITVSGPSNRRQP